MEAGRERRDGTAPLYRTPPAALAALADAPPWPVLRPSPCGRRILLATFEGWPPIEAVARPTLRLAGLVIDGGRRDHRRLQACTELAIVDVGGGARRRIDTPAGARMGAGVWSPDGTKVAFSVVAETGVEVWCADAASGRAWRLGDRSRNGVVGTIGWTGDSSAVAVLLAPLPRREPPSPPPVPTGPRIEESADRRATNWTYPNLLRTAHDDALFAHFLASEPALLDLGGALRSLGAADLYTRLEPAPDGMHFLVERLRPPFSRLVPWQRFAHDVSVRNRDGAEVVRVAERDAAEEVPLGGVPAGPRRVAWQPLEPATLFWVEALDGGDPRRAAVARDRALSWRAPFAAPPEELLRTGERLVGATWLDPPEPAPAPSVELVAGGERSAAESAAPGPAGTAELLVTEWHRDRRWLTTSLHDTATGAPPRVLFDRSARDDYGDPGHPLLRSRPGEATVRVERDAIFLAGRGATPAGDRPFLDRLSLTDGSKRRLVASTETSFEQVIALAGTASGEGAIGDGDALDGWVLRESAERPPALLLRRGDDAREIVAFPHPHPHLAGLRRRLLSYRRSDGVALSATLTLPPDDGVAPFPLLLWTYPIEHNEAATAGQVRAAPGRFLRLSPRSPTVLAACGYAVLSDVAMPIVGDPETVNDGFVAQIVDSARAAIAAAAASGPVDPERVAIGGHSYGAYTAASLLAHSRLFRAGIAESGAYNRTLTPFGFQGERRHLWDAPASYLALSPFLHADRIEAPLLLIHGELDENPGTHPLQSERLFHALQGLGKTARLVVVPAEGHRFVARESVLHVLAEWLDWLDRWVKGPPR